MPRPASVDLAEVSYRDDPSIQNSNHFRQGQAKSSISDCEDQIIDHLLSGDGSGVVGGQGPLQDRTEGSRLYDVSPAALLDLVLEQLASSSAATFLCFKPRNSARNLSDRIEMSGRLMPAAVNTSMVSSSAVMAFEASCRTAWD